MRAIVGEGYGETPVAEIFAPRIWFLPIVWVLRHYITQVLSGIIDSAPGHIKGAAGLSRNRHRLLFGGHHPGHRAANYTEHHHDKNHHQHGKAAFAPQ